MHTLVRITTVPISLQLLLNGQFGYMRAHGYDVITMSADGPEVAEIIKDGTRHVVIPFTRKITPSQDLRCLWLLIRAFRQLKPDIVHTHTPKAGLLGMLAARICRVPVRLHTVAGLPLIEASGSKRTILEAAERLTYACAHVVYSNSEGLKRFISETFGLSDEKLKIIGKGSSNGIDTAFFDRSPEIESVAGSIREKFRIGNGDFVFAFAGRIVNDKGITELVKAFQTISKEFSKNRLLLLLIGDFEEEHDPLPDEVVKYLTNDSRVILAGFQKDVRPWIVAADVFVFPSYREGFPNVVMQASLLQVPCIVSDINGCNEIISHGSTGIVVPAKNVDALAAAMRTLLTDEVLRKQYALAAQAFVAENFRREYIWEELRKEYEGMLNKNLEHTKSEVFSPQRHDTPTRDASAGSEGTENSQR